jgi:ribosomal protein L44E
MANRRLSPDELVLANALLAELRARMTALAADDAELHFALRRKIAKELSYDERSKPMERRRLKAQKRKDQNGFCAVCNRPLPARYTVLDRFEAVKGYTSENTRLICESCDRAVQQQRGYA